MGITVEVRKVYPYPFQHVVTSYINKYPTPLEKQVTAMKTVEENTDPATGIVYRRRIATCNNVVPSFLRKVTHVPSRLSTFTVSSAYISSGWVVSKSNPNHTLKKLY
ncbi:hypothetical protein FKM82_012264 [Ascaphus truei]